MATITEEKKEEVPTILATLTPPLIKVLLPTITLLTLKVGERRLTIRAREVPKNIKARVKLMRAPATKEDLLIMVHKNNKHLKEEVLLPTVTQKDIHLAVVPQLSMRILTITREERRLQNTMAKSIMKRTTITTSKRRTIQDRRHHRNRRRNNKRSSTTKNLIRSHLEVSSNTITRQEALSSDTKMDTKIIITRKRNQHSSNSKILITRQLLVEEAIKINTLKSPKIIRKKPITNLLVQILITNSKRQIKHPQTTMARKMITINARKGAEEGVPRIPMTIVTSQHKDIPLTALQLQSVAVAILIKSMEKIIITMAMKKK